MSTVSNESVQNKKLYRMGWILCSGVLGGPLGPIYMIGKNFQALGQISKAKKTFIIGILLTVLLFSIVMFLIPDSMNQEIQKGHPGILIAVIIYTYASNYQGPAVQEKILDGAQYYSFFKSLLVTILVQAIFWLIFLLTVCFITIFPILMHPYQEYTYLKAAKFKIAGDAKQAAIWLQKSSDAGSAWGACDLGYAYGTGKGVEKDLIKAKHYFEIAAAKGDSLAMYNIGCLYSNLDNSNNYLQIDYTKAAEWYQKSMQTKPNTCAANNLAYLYAEGLGVTKDAAKSKELFTTSGKLWIDNLSFKDQRTLNYKLKDLKVSTDHENLLEVYSEYQYSQITHTDNTDTLKHARPELIKMAKDFSATISKKCL